MIVLDSWTKQDHCPQSGLGDPGRVSYPMSSTTIQKHSDWFKYPLSRQWAPAMGRTPRVGIVPVNKTDGVPALEVLTFQSTCACWGWGGDIKPIDKYRALLWKRHTLQDLVCPNSHRAIHHLAPVDLLSVLISADYILVPIVHVPAMEKYCLLLQTCCVLSCLCSLHTWFLVHANLSGKVLSTSYSLSSGKISFLKPSRHASLKHPTRFYGNLHWYLQHQDIHNTMMAYAMKALCWSSHKHLNTYTSHVVIYLHVCLCTII